MCGEGKLIDPRNLSHVFVSPRSRARRTWEDLAEELKLGRRRPEVSVTEEIAEWNYGLYEGKLTKEIREIRKSHGLDQERDWDIWRDGCEGGEAPEQVQDRLDGLIAKIREVQGPNVGGGVPCDVVVVGHGHILRAFVKRWLEFPLEFPLSMMLEPGGVCGLSYQHGNIKEPALLVGMSYPS